MFLGNLLGSVRKKYRKILVEGICFDSRKVKKNDIFFAIKGKKNDGNFFIKESLKKGASFAVVNKIDRSAKVSKQLLVKDSLKSLTDISKKIRLISLANIIAITGSCGKTSLKEMLADVFSKIENNVFIFLIRYIM